MRALFVVFQQLLDDDAADVGTALLTAAAADGPAHGGASDAGTGGDGTGGTAAAAAAMPAKAKKPKGRRTTIGAHPRGYRIYRSTV